MRGHVGPKRAVTMPKWAVTMGRNTHHGADLSSQLPPLQRTNVAIVISYSLWTVLPHGSFSTVSKFS
ncbi:MAG TPA: hypothetical protein VFS23_41665, partial [Vicinamibacterales bacterium]|nr:hypothetical protein [Vicinamibacterales bacterium]